MIIDSIISLIILALFLTSTLLLGLKYKKGGNDIIEYTIGRKAFTTTTLIATVFATTYGGGWLIRTVEMIYTDGLWYIMMTVGCMIVCALVRVIVSHCIGIFMEDHVLSKGHISMANTLGQVYGRVPRIVAALATIGTSSASVAIQMTAISRTLQICISDVNPSVAMAIATSIAVCYSAFGGIQSVAITDILQCATFSIMIPYLTYRVWHHTNMTASEVFKSLSQSEKFRLAPILQNKMKILSLITACLSYARVSPEAVQRMYMARDSQQARVTYWISFILSLIITLIVVFLGIITYAGYRHIPDPSMIWSAVIGDSSATFKGLFVTGLFAMAMSTADSRLNAASSMLAHDIVNPLFENRLTGKQQLCLARATCFVIGILAILLSLHTRKHGNALLRLMFLYFDIGNPVIMAPFLLAVFGFKCKEEIAILGMAVGIIAIVLWNKFIPGINGSFVAMLANGITMLLAHYSLPKKSPRLGKVPV